MKMFFRPLIAVLSIITMPASSAIACPGLGFCQSKPASAYPYAEVIRERKYYENSRTLDANAGCDLVVKYPTNQMGSLIDGACYLQLDISFEGRPENIELTCSHSKFEQVIRNGIDNLQCGGREIAGQVIARRDIGYRIRFFGQSR